MQSGSFIKPRFLKLALASNSSQASLWKTACNSARELRICNSDPTIDLIRWTTKLHWHGLTQGCSPPVSPLLGRGPAVRRASAQCADETSHLFPCICLPSHVVSFPACSHDACKNADFIFSCISVLFYSWFLVQLTAFACNLHYLCLTVQIFPFCTSLCTPPYQGPLCKAASIPEVNKTRPLLNRGLPEVDYIRNYI